MRVCVLTHAPVCEEVTKFPLIAPTTLLELSHSIISSHSSFTLLIICPSLKLALSYCQKVEEVFVASVVTVMAWGGEQGDVLKALSSTPVGVRTVCNLISYALCVSLFFGAGCEQIEHCV